MIFSELKQFDKARDLVDLFIKHPDYHTTNLWEANTSGQGSYIFRGQADASWKISPSVFRSQSVLDNYTQQPPGPYNPNNVRLWLSLHVHAELHAVFTFLEVADKLGIETPIDYTRVEDHSDLFSNIFDGNLKNFKKKFPDDHALHTLEELALAQHHGIPTRLLDWTESPLIACYFAALEVSSVATVKNIKSDHIAVICLSMNSVKNSEEITTVNAIRHRNNNLRLQKGIFTHMPMANTYLIDNGHWPTLEDIVRCTPKLTGALKKYSLPVTEADNLLRILFDFEITTHHMMPSLDNIAKYYNYAKALFNLT